MTREPGTLIDAGVDWFTFTSSDRDLGGLMLHSASRLVHAQAQLGNELKTWQAMGYVGTSCGSVQHGEREDSCIVRGGGEVARNHWREIWKHAERCTRIDLQFTQFVGPQPSDVVQRYYRQARRSAKRKEAGPTVNLFAGTDGAATLYLGKRVSERFARCYNKEVESGLDFYRGCVRHEVEFKGDRAAQIVEQLAQEEDEPTFAEGMVRAMLATRAIYPARSQISRDGFSSSGSSMMLPVLPSLSRPPSDVYRSLNWLQASVSVVVQRLVDGGYGDEVLHALGVSIQKERLVRQRDFI